ncbi:lipoprotein LpqH [uncultured Corynebacterium sp.]|uniref:lipoprotein LpqH n=1 Tax=uncultured Corynebacterium sp. TaxID=159447 RepID=UPI0025ECF278|nr:lipoprotein LpqH [uncultured Corynebacterium sp.]
MAAALSISVAACSSEDSDDGATDKETVTTTVQESAEASGSSEESEQPRDTQKAPAQESSGSKLHKISVDGKAVDTKLLSPVRCELGEDDGREVLEVDFGKDDDDRNELDIDIYTDQPALDSLDFEYKGVEYEIDDEHAGSATVKRQGDKYVVEGTPVEDDSNRTIALSVEFTCAN